MGGETRKGCDFREWWSCQGAFGCGPTPLGIGLGMSSSVLIFCLTTSLYPCHCLSAKMRKTASSIVHPTCLPALTKVPWMSTQGLLQPLLGMCFRRLAWWSFFHGPTLLELHATFNVTDCVKDSAEATNLRWLGLQPSHRMALTSVLQQLALPLPSGLAFYLFTPNNGGYCCYRTRWNPHWVLSGDTNNTSYWCIYMVSCNLNWL